MADKFPHLPGLVVGINDNALSPQPAVVTSPSVLVIGTASRGPAAAATLVSGPGGAAQTFGSDAALSLNQGLIEAQQGGAPATFGFRILAKAGKVVDIGGGITVESAAVGSDCFDDLGIIFKESDASLKVKLLSTGLTVYDSADPSKDLGLVSVSGAVDAGVSNASIGKHIVVSKTGTIADQDENADNEHTVNAAGHTLTIEGINRFNLDLLGDVAGGNVIVHLKKASSSAVYEGVVASVDGAVVTMAAGHGAADGADYSFRFYRLDQPAPINTLMKDRLEIQKTNLLPGSDIGGLQLQAGSTDGYLAKATDGVFVEVAPPNLSLYEGLCDAADALETQSLDVVVPMDMHLDAPNIADGVTLPSTLSSDVIEPQSGNSFLLTNQGADDLDGKSRDNMWLIITEDATADFGAGQTGAKMRAARVLGWDAVDGANKRKIYLDRDLPWALAGEAVDSSKNPSYLLVDLSAAGKNLLLYYRREVVAGEVRHCWYHQASDPDGKEYHEVNFAYRLARFCNDITVNDNFAIGVIGVEPPSNHFQPAKIGAWLGDLPSYDADTGSVLEAGSGLLGNKFLAGSVEGGVQFKPGFFQTKSGYLDDVTSILDDNGTAVDMGRYLSVVVSYPILRNNSSTSASGYIASGAAVYAGLLAGLVPWSAATGKSVGSGNVALPSRLAKRYLNSIAGLGAVAFTQDAIGSVSVSDAPSAALRTSDFTRNMTTRMAGEVIDRLRSASSSFIGEPLSAARKAGLETALKRALADVKLESGGVLEDYSMGLSQTPVQKISGIIDVSLSLRVVGELRRINLTLSLSL